MKIKVIIPIVPTIYNKDVETEVNSVKAPDCEISFENLSKGTAFIESRYAEFLDTQSIIEISKKAEQDGYDGIFIDCFGSPGVSIVRELVNIPVLGGFDGAILSAMVISQKFSIISVVPSVIPMLRSLARDLGVTESLASIRVVNIPVNKIGDRELLKKRLVEQSLLAIDEDGAEAIVLGCTGMLNVVQAVSKILREKNKPAPVVDPTTAAIGTLQSLIRNGLAQSRLSYFASAARDSE